MKETDGLIERVRRVNDTHQQIDITVSANFPQIKPGQSLLARVGDAWEPYLREQWWPVATTKTQITVERPLTTTYEYSQVVNLIGALGQPFRFRRTLRNVLLVAYDTPPTPLLMTIPSLLSNRVSVTLVLLGDAARYGTEHLPPEVEVIIGDSDLNWANRVTTIGWADQVFLTVPQADELGHFRRVYELFGQLRAEIPQSYLFGIFQPLLPCGIGACQACLLRLRGSTALICTQGPAFDLTQVLLG